MQEQRCFFPAFLTPEGKKKPSAPSLLVGQKLSLAPADYRFLPNEDSQSQPSLRASARFHQGLASPVAMQINLPAALLWRNWAVARTMSLSCCTTSRCSLTSNWE